MYVLSLDSLQVEQPTVISYLDESSALDVCWQIFNTLSPLDRIRLSHTSRSWRAAFEPYHLHLLSKLLLRFFPASSPAEFRALQKETGMVISGSAAIQVLENEIWEESDLDLYVEHPNLGRVADFVLSNGYIFRPSEKQIEQADGETLSFEEAYETEMPDSYVFGNIAAVYTFLWGERKVQIISTHCPVLKLILGFHSTVVMNLITHSTIYSLYPHATFQSGLNLHLMCDGRESDQHVAREKYDRRGWTTVRELSNAPFETVHQALTMRARWLGDRYTLSIQLDGGSSPPPPRDGDLDPWADSWALGSLGWPGGGINAKLITTTLRLPALKKEVCVLTLSWRALWSKSCQSW
ncbi:hypothetical protein B0H14DRAFT_2365524 [Mycena olivaceomarginata]|nr:hypothetical protein B0H14DRAFT_2365524 [Mycena olivaceomarginata]